MKPAQCVMFILVVVVARAVYQGAGWVGGSRGDDGDSFISLRRQKIQSGFLKKRSYKLRELEIASLKKGAWLKCKNMAE